MMLGFARLGSLGFGGVAPQAYAFLVVDRRWISDGDFAELMGLGQALPGANVVNVVTILGDRWFGLRGAIAAPLSIMALPVVVAVLIAAAVTRIENAPRFIAVESAVTAAAAGLVLATGYRILASIKVKRWLAYLLAALTALPIALGASLPLVVAVVCVGGILAERIPERTP